MNATYKTEDHHFDLADGSYAFLRIIHKDVPVINGRKAGRYWMICRPSSSLYQDATPEEIQMLEQVFAELKA